MKYSIFFKINVLIWISHCCEEDFFFLIKNTILYHKTISGLEITLHILSGVPQDDLFLNQTSARKQESLAPIISNYFFCFIYASHSLYTLYKRARDIFKFFFVFFFYQGFLSRTLTTHRDSRGREGIFFFYSTLPLPPGHKHSDLYVQLCT